MKKDISYWINKQVIVMTFGRYCRKSMHLYNGIARVRLGGGGKFELRKGTLEAHTLLNAKKRSFSNRFLLPSCNTATPSAKPRSHPPRLPISIAPFIHSPSVSHTYLCIISCVNLHRTLCCIAYTSRSTFTNETHPL